MPTLEEHAHQLWATTSRAPALATALALAKTVDSTPAYLLLLDFDTNHTAQAQHARDVLSIAVEEGAAMAVHALNACSLWQMAALATCHSSCNLYLNMDLLTIDPHAQDWGDFKIKPEQVAVQRDELTQKALFKPRWGFVAQVPKEALSTVMDMLRTAELVANSTVIGRTWGAVAKGEAVLDVYRDAKKQLSITAQLLLNASE